MYGAFASNVNIITFDQSGVKAIAERGTTAEICVSLHQLIAFFLAEVLNFFRISFQHFFKSTFL